jgi:hypothetical protein
MIIIALPVFRFFMRTFRMISQARYGSRLSACTITIPQSCPLTESYPVPVALRTDFGSAGNPGNLMARQFRTTGNLSEEW